MAPHTPCSACCPAAVRMQARLAGLGMLAAELPEGRLTGHTFHYSTADTPLDTRRRAPRVAPGTGTEAIYRHRRLTASYMHFYFPSNPEAAARLFLP